MREGSREQRVRGVGSINSSEWNSNLNSPSFNCFSFHALSFFYEFDDFDIDTLCDPQS